MQSGPIVLLGDYELDVYVSREHDLNPNLSVSRLHNRVIRIDGIPHVLCVGEPDEKTIRLSQEQ